MDPVDVVRVGRIVRVLRVRQRFTQAELANRARVSLRTIWLLETGRGGSLRISAVGDVLGALGARTDLRVLWNGPELDRLLDRAHAAVVAASKRRLERWGWLVRIEVSYSRYGERGRIDLLAWHPATGNLLVVEVKTDLVDVQSLLGTLDAKARLGRHVASQFGWEIRAVTPAIVFAEDRTIRNRLMRLDTLFDRFSLRGRAAISWLRHPDRRVPGLLWFTAIPASESGALPRTAAPRVRHRAA